MPARIEVFASVYGEEYSFCRKPTTTKKINYQGA